MARFGQGLIQALTNPSYAGQLNQAGMMAGSMPGRLRTEEAERLKKLQAAEQAQAQQRASMQAYVNATTGNTDNNALMGAVHAGSEAAPLIAAAGAGDSLHRAQLAEQERERVRQEAEKEALINRQREAEVTASVAARAKRHGYPQETIDAYAHDPKGLNALVSHKEQREVGEGIDNNTEKSQINQQTLLAHQRGADEAVLQDIKDGKYVGKTAELIGMLRGEGNGIGSFQNIETGAVSALTTLNGKVFIDNRWVNPSEAGLVKAPTRTAEDSTATFTEGQRSTRSTFSALSSGVIEDWVNETTSISDLQKQLTETTANPFTRDATARLRQVQNIVPDSLARLQSGAAIKEDEMDNFNDAFQIQIKDVFSPQMLALKTIRTLLLSETASRLTTGELSPPQARARVQEIAAMGLSESDKEKLADGQFKAVIAPYISKIKGEDAPAPKSTSGVTRFDAQGNRI